MSLALLWSISILDSFAAGPPPSLVGGAGDSGHSGSVCSSATSRPVLGCSLPAEPLVHHELPFQWRKALCRWPDFLSER